ncbi:ABC transporter permease subunit [Campylobacter curvus]|uniref:ABC transporter permease subunit n=1 Tax=Campylobacter curvus TaxID=200 RepID=UPI00147063F5|nr:ABC transporter permease subunit [Campylobacter curvus]
MKSYIFRRTAYIVPMLLVVSVFIFLILRLNGTDAAMSYLNASGISPSDQALAHAKEVLGLDKPLLQQYLLWLKKALTLDFGRSYITGSQVSADMAYYLPNTLKLIGFALLLTVAISLPLGILSALYKDKWVDHIVRFISFLGVSTPNFWLALILISVFSVKFKILPPFGTGGLSHIIMPAFAISFMSIAINARLIRTNMLELMHSRHVLYANMRGIAKFQVIVHYVLKNALIPIVTALGMHLGELVGSAMVIENVFAYAGIGRYTVAAIINNDYPVIQSFILFMALVFIVSNLITDIIYAYIDPRVRLAA